MEFLLLLTMIFTHIFADFNLQSIGAPLHEMKTQEWWEKQTDDKVYKNDYMVCLFAHSFEWTFIMMLPILLFNKFNVNEYVYSIVIIINTYIHMMIDNEKANNKSINLINDQLLHFIQIFATWGFFAYGGF